MRPEPEALRQRILSALPDAQIEIVDESHLHAGHAGAQGGAGHYRVRVVSGRFATLRTVMRHRLVYDAVGDWMPQRVHALSIEARSPSEAAAEPKDPIR